MKRKVYKMAVRVALTKIYKMEVAELKMLRFSLGVTKDGWSQNQYVIGRTNELMPQQGAHRPSKIRKNVCSSYNI